MGDRLARSRSNANEIHIFEPTGYAGIFQHSYQLAQLLSAQTDLRVVLHTAEQHEELSLGGVEVCRCCWWPRGTKRGPLLAKLKQAAIAVRLISITLPSLLLSMNRGSVLHLQGVGAHGFFNLLILATARMRGCRVVYSPHDTFSRKGSIDGQLLRMAYRPAHAVIVYSRADEERLNVIGPRVYRSPLILSAPLPSGDLIRGWRREWEADHEGSVVVLCPGFIRPERRLDLLVESARSWPSERLLAVVGEDRGGWARCKHLADKYKINVAARIGFIDLDEFAAAIAAADLVVVPSEQASQSGVLAFARQFGKPTVAAEVGGMAEQANRTFSPGNVDELTAAIQAELEAGSVNGTSAQVNTVESYLRAYDRL